MFEQQRHRSTNQIIGSVIATSKQNLGTTDATPTLRPNQTRFGRQTSASSPTGLPAAVLEGDILVRLVGQWHAHCALHYYLCYLLASSIAILVFIRLVRLFKSRRTPTPAGPAIGLSGSYSTLSHGFNQQTRLGEYQAITKESLI